MKPRSPLPWSVFKAGPTLRPHTIEIHDANGKDVVSWMGFDRSGSRNAHLRNAEAIVEAVNALGSRSRPVAPLPHVADTDAVVWSGSNLHGAPETEACMKATKGRNVGGLIQDLEQLCAKMERERNERTEECERHVATAEKLWDTINARSAARSAAPVAATEYDYGQRDNETDERYANRIVARCDRLERELAQAQAFNQAADEALGKAARSSTRDTLLAAADAITRHCLNLRDPVVMANRLRDLASSCCALPLPCGADNCTHTAYRPERKSP